MFSNLFIFLCNQDYSVPLYDVLLYNLLILNTAFYLVVINPTIII